PSRRSRVSPGVSSTSASRRPTSRLNSVDFPTFGRPRIATAKPIAGIWATRLRLAIGRQSGVVGQHIKRIVGDYRRKIATGRYLLAPERLSGIGRDRQCAAVRGEDDQPVTAEYRARPGNRILPLFLVLVTRQHPHPPYLTLVPREADQLVVVGQHEDVIPGHPETVGTAEFLFPRSFAASEVDRCHPSAMAGGIDPPAVDDRPSAHIGESGDRIDAAR